MHKHDHFAAVHLYMYISTNAVAEKSAATPRTEQLGQHCYLLPVWQLL
jgi:hypothetical protein